jgi:Tfp pilus assembly protein PilF
VAEAEALYRRALRIKETVLGPEHPELVTTLNNLGVFCADQNRPAEAEARYRWALAILESSVDAAHPRARAVADNLAKLTSRS